MIESTIIHSLTPEQIASVVCNVVTKQVDELKKQFQPIQPTEFLTKTEVKDYFKVDLSTIHNWTKKGKLRSYGVGGRIYYKRHEIESVFIAIN